MLRKLGKYEILDEIGHGGMATVYRARDTRLERPVAIKIMHPHLRAAPEARVRFAREAKSVAKLRHPNILEIYDSSEEDSEEAYIVTELLTGPTLKEFAEKHLDHIPAEIAACFVIEIARALDAAHAAGIVHRDVKPENVLLHEARCMKLTDFGIAQMVDSQSFTATGQILGSPGHMAPEQVEGGVCDHRTDIFSLGTVLYYLATGRLPFSGKNPHQVLKRIVDVDYADPLRVRPSIGGKLRAIIIKSLARSADERYQTAREMEEELLAFVGEAGIDDPSAMLARYMPEPEKVASELRADLVARLTARGKRLADDGDVPGALDDFNRVLALDEGNEHVLLLIERIGRRSRRRTWMMAAGAALGVFGLAAMGYAFLADPRGGDPAVVVAESPSTVDAAIRVEPDAGARADAALARATPDAGPRATKVARVGPVRQRVDPPVHGGPRTVRFNFQACQDVAIAIDGGEPRPYGPGFSSVELEPGRHRFAFIPTPNSKCAEREATVNVPAGAEPFVLEQHIGFLPAVLLVDTGSVRTAHVSIGGVTGRPRTPIYVPMTSLHGIFDYTVTAPDHRAYTGQVELTAGETSQLDVELEAPGSGP